MQVLFVDGTITCYTTWQYAVALYAVTCVTPFCLILAIGPELLRTGRLSLTEFFIGCLCPLPVLFVCLYRRLRYGPPSSINTQVGAEFKVVFTIADCTIRRFLCNASYLVRILLHKRTRTHEVLSDEITI